MANKKSGFWTFVFSLFPGAGEMYLGFYKQGISLMMLFCGLGVISGWAHLEVFWFLEPVIWFYSFFHVHNLRGMAEEDFCWVKDRFLWEDYIEAGRDWTFTEKKKRAFAAVLIVFGVYILFKSVFYGMFWYIQIPNFLLEAFDLAERLLPRFIVGIGIIYLGIRMLQKEAEPLEESGQEAESKS